MAELAEWSAQALRCQGSDVPVKVVYIQSRAVAETSDSFYQHRNYGLIEQSRELGKQISHHASGRSDLRAVFSGHLFDPVEVLDSKNYILQGKESFEDRKSALEALLSKFKNPSRVVPFDPEASHGPKVSYAQPTFIDPSQEEDLLLYLFNYIINEKDIEGVPIYRQGERKREGKGKGEDEKKEDKEGSKRREELKRRKEKEEDGEKEKKMEEERRKKPSNWREELRGITPPNVNLGKLSALISGIITEFNPSGMWIVEEFFNDEEEVQ